MNIWLLLGSVSGFLSVATGAFGAHALASRLSERALAIWHTSAQYQMYHALALLAVGVLSAQTGAPSPATSLCVAGWAFTLGSLIFCGSLYGLAMTDIKWLGAITPIGGVAFMVGWVSLAVFAAKYAAR